MAEEPGPSRRLEVFALVLAAVLAALAVRSQMGAEQLPSWLLPVDDAYIFIRYAEQAAGGHPWQWNTGEPSTGATDPAFTALLVPGQWLFGDLAGWSIWSSFVGLVALAGLGLAAASLTRALLPDAGWWPLAAGLAVIGGGPFAYFSIGGMDNAFAAAMLLGALAALLSSEGRRGPVWIACLPWVRPDYAVVVGLAAIWMFVLGRGTRTSRALCSALLFVPGLLLMALNFALTGHASPGGALAKSVFSDPFQRPQAAVAAVTTQFTDHLLPVYLGLRATVLPPPVGWLAVAVVFWVLWVWVKVAWSRRPLEDERTRRLLLPVLVWLGLASVAVTSGYLWWQRLRHHHPGLALAWVLAFVGLATWLRSRPKASLSNSALVVMLGVLPWIGLAEVSRDYAAATRSFFVHNFRPAVWLQNHLSQSEDMPVVATHDAGLFSLVAAPLERDVSKVDLMGLGTTDMALPYRDGVGAIVEHLARRDPLPTLAVGRRELLRLGPLLGPELFSSTPGAPNAMIVSPIDATRLRGTVLTSPGIDFGYRPSEERVGLRWDPPPPTSAASLGAMVPISGVPVVQGCRPLQGQLVVKLRGLEDAGSKLVVTFTAVRLSGSGPPPPAVVSGSAGGAAEVAEASRVPGRLVLPAASELRLERAAGSEGVPCLESVAVVD